MKNDAVYVHNMYVRLCASALAHSPKRDWKLADMARIATDRHCGNDYWSFDGMLDDLTEMFGDEDVASEILNKA